MLKDDYLNYLRSNVCKVVFTKASGEERTMICSSDPIYFVKPFDGTKRPTPDTQVNVWDLEKQDWRSFNVDSVKEFYLQVRGTHDIGYTRIDQ